MFFDQEKSRYVICERFNKIEAIIKKRDKKLSNKKSIKEPDQPPEPAKEIKDNANCLKFNIYILH